MLSSLSNTRLVVFDESWRPTCILLFNDSCEEKTKRYMHPHSHPDLFNMELCRWCGAKRLSHTQTDQENRWKYENIRAITKPYDC